MTIRLALSGEETRSRYEWGKLSKEASHAP
jgi:hypothetical protein